MEEQIVQEDIVKAAQEEAEKAEGSRALYEVKMKFLGRAGIVTAMLKKMKDISPEERPSFGKKVNAIREKLEQDFAAAEARVKQRELAAKLESETLDVTMPGKRQKKGALHPVTRVKNELVDIFAGMGFEIFEGPEIENDYYNFTALNTPADHPARDMQDTFYLSEEYLLRTQTSAGQIRFMEEHRPPIKMLSPGRVFRSDDDATHALAHVPPDGRARCRQKRHAVRSSGHARRIRAHHVLLFFEDAPAPFLLPLHGAFRRSGRLVRGVRRQGLFPLQGEGTGWIEVLGAGMVNRRVLENCHIDPDEYTGFAFGMGIERIAMLKYGINNIKLLTENDVRFLEQFKD